MSIHSIFRRSHGELYLDCYSKYLWGLVSDIAVKPVTILPFQAISKYEIFSECLSSIDGL